MTMQASHIDEWLNKAFSLAYFLHNDREIAKKIAVGAMNKLETASNAQFKRYYYTPTGRDGSKISRNRVSLNDLQLLQRLVFVESEAYEREQERSARICERRLLRYFIKHLVRISLKRNSFYVTLAISRILHNYATADAMEIYNVVVQDPERVHDDYYYRSRKGVLMKELKARFGELLEVVKVNRGEERFDTKPADDHLTETAYECLRSFTPWNTSCTLPEKFDPFADVIKPFYFDKKDPDEEHRTEVNRIHAALHPDCFSRLTQALNLSSPDDKMEIPKFMMTEIEVETDDTGRNGPSSPLHADELEQIKEILSAQAASRKAANAGFLRVVADGVQIGQVGNGLVASQFELGGEAELIEIYSRDNTLLATHLLDFDELRSGPQTQTIVLEGGQKITFDLAPVLDRFGEVAEVNFGVRYAETGWLPRLGAAFANAKATIANTALPLILRPAPALGLVLVALVGGWLVFQAIKNDNGLVAGSAQSNYAVDPSREQQLPPNQIDKDSKERFEPDDRSSSPRLVKRSPPRPKPNLRSSPTRKPEVEQAPPDGHLAVNTTDENGILRVPIRETAVWRPMSDPRSANKKIPGEQIEDVTHVYIEHTGDQVLGKRIAEDIASKLAGGPLTVTTDQELAGAKMKLHVRHESDVDDPEEKTVAVMVRLVNAKGFVIYPNRKGITGWKYVGTINKLPARVAEDLLKAKK